MFCPKCGTETPDDSQFCRKCGFSLGVVSTGGGTAAAPATESEPKRNLGIGILLAILCVVIVVASISRFKPTESAQQQVQQPPPPQPRLFTKTFDTAITVKAAGFYYVEFPVPDGSSNVKFQGHFAATGGVGNDIAVYFMNEDEFTNWRNGHQTNALYSSGKVTQDSPSISVPNTAGTYYLVFDNRFSLLTPKAVQTNFSLTYFHL